MKVGIFGGTFNPPHMGHLIVAEHVREQLSMERILFIPSDTSPHKQNMNIASGEDRLEMLRCAIKGNPYFDVSDMELRRGGVSYTVDTLEALGNQHPALDLHLLIGLDNLTDFDSWKSPDRILELSTLVAMTRPGFEETEVGPKLRRHVILCNVPEIAIASSAIRRRLYSGRSIRYLVPPTVERYIKERNLYRPHS